MSSNRSSSCCSVADGLAGLSVAEQERQRSPRTTLQCAVRGRSLLFGHGADNGKPGSLSRRLGAPPDIWTDCTHDIADIDDPRSPRRNFYAAAKKMLRRVFPTQSDDEFEAMYDSVILLHGYPDDCVPTSWRVAPLEFNRNVLYLAIMHRLSCGDNAHEFRTALVQTHPALLVYCSEDPIRGIGFSAKEAQERYACWGLNLYGKVLTYCRHVVIEKWRAGVLRIEPLEVFLPPIKPIYPGSDSKTKEPDTNDVTVKEESLAEELLYKESFDYIATPEFGHGMTVPELRDEDVPEFDDIMTIPTAGNGTAMTESGDGMSIQDYGDEVGSPELPELGGGMAMPAEQYEGLWWDVTEEELGAFFLQYPSTN